VLLAPLLPLEPAAFVLVPLAPLALLLPALLTPPLPPDACPGVPLLVQALAKPKAMLKIEIALAGSCEGLMRIEQTNGAGAPNSFSGGHPVRCCRSLLFMLSRKVARSDLLAARSRRPARRRANGAG
jgi:hypothetical protein